MKLPAARSHHQPRSRRAGFTLAELVTATALCLLLVLATVYSHLVGLKMYNLTATKLNSNQAARSALNHVRDEIRSSQCLYVGTGNATAFTTPSTNGLRVGNALQIYPTTSTNVFVRYYLDTSDQTLKRTSDLGGTEVVAACVTNTLPFCAEDYAGNIMTNDLNCRVIKMTLQFQRWEMAAANPAGAQYDYYQIQTRIARRSR